MYLGNSVKNALDLGYVKTPKVILNSSRWRSGTAIISLNGTEYRVRYLTPIYNAGSDFANMGFSIGSFNRNDTNARYRLRFRDDLYLCMYITHLEGYPNYYMMKSGLISTNSATQNPVFSSGSNWDFADGTERHLNSVVTPCVGELNEEEWIGYIATAGNSGYGNLFSIADIKKIPSVNIDLVEVDEEYGVPSTEGGYSGGGFDDSSDVIGIPNKPTLSVSSMGFVNVYRPIPNTLNGMVDELFPTVDIPDLPTGGDLSDVVNAVNSLVDMLANGIVQFGNKNLLDYVLDAHIIPVTPTVTASEQIKVGYKTLSQSAPKVSDDYVDFDCGTISIPEYYSNYIDYQTRIKVYLPFVGYVPILPEHILNGQLNVYYRFNVLDGSFCAWIRSTSSKSNLKNSVIGSFSGNCCVHIPISATNYSNVISGMVGGVSNMINSVSHESLSGAMKGTQEMLQTSKPDVSLSNGYNATSSYCGIRRPYLIIERPVASFSQGYPYDNGLPLNVYKKLSDISGKTIIDEFNTNMLDCTEEEKQMVIDGFKEGVIL